MAHEGFGSSLLEDVQGGKTRVEIIGNGQVMVENHRGIVEYEDTRLRIRCKGCEVCITGTELALCALSMEELVVSGVIATVEYITSSGRGDGR